MKITESVMKKAARRDQVARTKSEEAREALEETIWQAQEQGKSITWISSHIPHMSRQSVHHLLKKMANQRGGTKNDRVRAWLRENSNYPVGDVGPITPSLVQDYDNWVKHQEEIRALTAVVKGLQNQDT